MIAIVSFLQYLPSWEENSPSSEEMTSQKGKNIQHVSNGPDSFTLTYTKQYLTKSPHNSLQNEQYYLKGKWWLKVLQSTL